MRTVNALLTVVLFIMVFVSFVFSSPALYTAIGLVFCVNVAIATFARGGNNNDTDDNQR